MQRAWQAEHSHLAERSPSRSAWTALGLVAEHGRDQWFGTDEAGFLLAGRAESAAPTTAFKRLGRVEFCPSLVARGVEFGVIDAKLFALAHRAQEAEYQLRPLVGVGAVRQARVVEDGAEREEAEAHGFVGGIRAVEAVRVGIDL